MSMFRENKEEFCKALCDTLRLTSCAGHPDGNPLKELRYMKIGTTEIVRPIFEDGTGESGHYDVNVSGDSCIGILNDVMNKFVKKIW